LLGHGLRLRDPFTVSEERRLWTSSHPLGMDGQRAVTDFGRTKKAQEGPMTVWIYVDAGSPPLVTGVDAVQNDRRAGAEGEMNHDSKS